VVDLFRPIVFALAAAHARNESHRDLKPDSVLVVTEAGRPAFKLLDFGTARFAAERARRFVSNPSKLSPVGLAWAAPEQVSVRHGATGPATDVYQMALLVSSLLSGRLPYGEGDLASSMARIDDEAARPTPRALGAQVPDAVESVLQRALAVRPVDRPSVLDLWSRLA
jgi:serine/threonine-protein kinase